MKDIKKYINTNPKKIARNIPFLISAAAMGCLVYLNIYNIPALAVFCALAAVCAIFVQLDFSVIKRNVTQYKLLAAALTALFTTVTYYTAMNKPGAGGVLYGIMDAIGIGYEKFIAFSAVAGGIASVYFVLTVLCFAEEKLNLSDEFKLLWQRMSEYKNIKQSFVIISGLYLLSIITLIRADINYVDDITRKANGIPGWDNYSRYLSNVLSNLIHTNSYIADISPLLQILAVLLVAAASIIVIMLFTDSKKISMWTVAAVLPLGMSPYFMGCYSYKYDAAYMALSVLAGVFPLLFSDRKTSLYIAVTAVSMLTIGLTYQAAFGIFPVMVILLCFTDWQKGGDIRNGVNLAVKSVAGYLTGVFAFRVLFMKPVTNGYVSSELLSVGEMPFGVLKNIKGYLVKVFYDFDIKWTVCLIVIFAAFVIFSAVKSKQNKAVTFVLAGVVEVICVSLSFGLYIAFVNPLTEVRAMYGFGVCVAAIAVTVVQNAQAKIPKFCAVYFAWCLLVFGFMYGNALSEQYRYAEFRMEMVLSDLQNVDTFAHSEEVNLQIKGGVGDSPLIKNMPQSSKVMSRMIFTVFDATWSEGLDYFRTMYGIKYNKVKDLDEANLELVVDGYYHSIYSDEENVLVVLKRQ